MDFYESIDCGIAYCNKVKSIIHWAVKKSYRKNRVFMLVVSLYSLAFSISLKSSLKFQSPLIPLNITKAREYKDRLIKAHYQGDKIHIITIVELN